MNSDAGERLWALCRHSLLAMLLALIASGAGMPAMPAESEGSVSPEQALALLKEGNARFMAGKAKVRDFKYERSKLVAGQQPYAIILSCADSRVPPELIFDEGLGRLFIIRVAGDIVDPVVLGSAEYAAEHLGSTLMVVLGHSSCGAVKATLAGGEASPNIKALMERIQPAVDKARKQTSGETAQLNLAIRENVLQQLHDAVGQSGILREKVERKKLLLAGAVYDLASGAVEFLPAAAH